MSGVAVTQDYRWVAEFDATPNDDHSLTELGAAVTNRCPSEIWSGPANNAISTGSTSLAPSTAHGTFRDCNLGT